MNNSFNADMMIVARRVRGVTQSGLAQSLGVSQAKISKIEAGLIMPDSQLVEHMAGFLEFRPSFFLKETRLSPAPVNFHRKRQKLGVHDWETIVARAELYRIIVEQFLRSVELLPSKNTAPQIDPDQFDGDIARISAAVRQSWLLPRGPISDVTKAIEDAGIIVVPFDFGTELIDGFCQQAIDSLPPLIFINTRIKAKDRIRFSLAHELGHLVMHRLPTQEMESEANRFAAAFLMPEEDIRQSLYTLSLDKFMTLKVYWKTSMQSLIRRARDLNRLSDRGYKYYQIQMGKRGWRASEPVVIDGNIESPKTLEKLFVAHRDDLGFDTDQLSGLIGILPAQARDMFPSDKPRLRLVT